MAAGKFDATFLAEDLQCDTEQRYIIKLLPTNQHVTPEQFVTLKKKFKQEARILEVLGSQHPQILSLHDHFSLVVVGFNSSQINADRTDKLFYLVEEYVEGQTLTQEFKQRGPFRETEVLDILQQILSILQFIHEHEYRVVHEDIHPDNILRDYQGQVHLANFGAIRRVIAEETIGVSIRPPNLWVVPPEQRAGQPLSPSSDLYALATTMLWLLTDDDITALFDPQTQSWNWKPYIQVSDRLGTVLDKMLQSEASQRFQSAADAIAALNYETPVLLELDAPQPVSLAAKMATVFPQETLALGQVNGTHSTNGTHKMPLKESAIQTGELSRPKVRELDIYQPTPSKIVTPKPQPDSNSNNTPISSASISSAPISSAPSEHTRSLPSSPSEKTDQPISDALRQAAVLGSGGWLVVAMLASFLGTILASGLWLLMLSGVIFGLMAKHYSRIDQIRLLVIAIASAGLTLLLLPKAFRFLSLSQIVSQMLLLTLASGLFALILLLLSQSIYNMMSKK
jgi:serine/threonine protein kinase